MKKWYLVTQVKFFWHRAKKLETKKSGSKTKSWHQEQKNQDQRDEKNFRKIYNLRKQKKKNHG